MEAWRGVLTLSLWTSNVRTFLSRVFTCCKSSMYNTLYNYKGGLHYYIVVYANTSTLHCMHWVIRHIQCITPRPWHHRSTKMMSVRSHELSKCCYYSTYHVPTGSEADQIHGQQMTRSMTLRLKWATGFHTGDGGKLPTLAKELKFLPPSPSWSVWEEQPPTEQ